MDQVITITANNFYDLTKFKHVVHKDSVFRNIEVLDFSYIPDKLYMRNDIINTLICSFRRIIIDNKTSTNCLLTGLPGSGKTTIARYFAKNFRQIVLETIPNFHIEYFNCLGFRRNDTIVANLVKKYCYSSGKGYAAEEFWVILLKKLIYTKNYLFIILDNIDYLSQQDLLQILSLPESFGHQNIRISFLFISRSKQWDEYKNQEINQRIYDLIKIKPYSFEEAYTILKDKYELAFKENVISEDLITQLAQIVVNTKNMRYGIEYLRKLGTYADTKGFKVILPEHLKKIPKEPYFEHYEVIEKLSIHELLAYKSVCSALDHSDITTIEKAYLEYEKSCTEYKKKTHHILTFGKYIRNLAKFKLINKEIKQYSKYGRYAEISLSYNPKGIKKEVEMFLNQKLV